MNKYVKFFRLAFVARILAAGATLCLILAATTSLALAQKTKTPLTFYYGQGCPHCSVVEQYFNDHKVGDNFEITRKEVYQNPVNALELSALFESYRVPDNQRGVPFMVLGGQYYVGDSPIIAAIEAAAVQPPAPLVPPAPAAVVEIPLASQPVVTTVATTSENNATRTAPVTPVPAAPRQLNFFVITGAALVDAINPCEFAVLIILMATVMAAASRRRALFSGLLFSLAVYLSYLAMGLGLYSAVAAFGAASWIQRIVGVLAIVLGLLNVKDAIWYGKGFLIEVPMSWRPRMKAILHSVTSPLAALGAGFLVSLFLLPCTSGPYIVIVGMLGKESTFSQAVGWLVYYNLIFILPMLAITLAAYFGLKPETLEEVRQRRLRWLHAIAGVLLLALGAYLLI